MSKPDAEVLRLNPEFERVAKRQRLEQEARWTEQFALLGRLAAGVSHELRNPLAAVFLQVDLPAEELAQPYPDSLVMIVATLSELKAPLARRTLPRVRRQSQVLTSFAVMIRPFILLIPPPTAITCEVIASRR